MYTRNSAFMANDDDKRGTLEPGKFADLAVLSADYLTAPVKGDRENQIGADDGRRQCGVCGSAVCEPRTAPMRKPPEAKPPADGFVALSGLCLRHRRLDRFCRDRQRADTKT